ncbi:MAG: S1/P1 nuclease [Glaciecola sp.]
MKLFINVCIAAALLATSAYQHAVAWGQTGHRVTGEIAELHLSDNAKTAIRNILNNESLAEVSTYADEMRSNPSQFWQKVAGPFHYVTVPAGKRYKDVGAPEKGDSVTALKMYTEVLKNPDSTRQNKQLAIKMIVHIIGDLHQPLHAGNGTDRGGNDVKLTFFWEASNLHRVWDSGLIDRKQLSFTEWTKFLAPKISDEQLVEWQTTDPLVYIHESTIIRDKIYPDNDELSWQYLYDHTPIMKVRLQQAGVRIASYFNKLYDA